MCVLLARSAREAAHPGRFEHECFVVAKHKSFLSTTNMKHPLNDAMLSLDTRRGFLRVMTLPLGVSVLGGCGGGLDADAAGLDQSEAASLGDQGAVAAGFPPPVSLVDKDPSPANAPTVLPAWVPPAGTFTNISTNTMVDVRPTGWPESDSAGPFANWSGGVYANDFSTLGAYVVHGSGHLTPGTPTWAGVWCFDLDTLKWVGRNVPAQPLLESNIYDSVGESTIAATAGHPYPPHTYDGLVYQPATRGGGSNGALLRVSSAGNSFGTPIHQFDLSSTTAPPKRVLDAVGGTSYPAAAADLGRNGLWYLDYNGNGPLKFVSFTDWSVKKHPGVEYNQYGNHNLIYLPAPFDCLVGIGSSDTRGASFGVYVCPIVKGAPQGFTRVTTSGIPPSDTRCGGQWSMLLQCIVSYQAGGSPVVHKLLPPSGALTTGTWAWTTETLVGQNGVTPAKGMGNGAWSRFVEVPAARCFIWCDSVNGPVQAWRLAGM